MRAHLSMFVVGLVVAAGLKCQVPIWSRQGTPLPIVTLLTGPLTVIGDVNADGHADLLQYVGGSLPFQAMWMFSGRDGATLRIRPPFSLIHAVQTIATTGDMNGDGIGDYALGLVSTSGDIVQVRSASDDSLLWQATGSWVRALS